MESTLATWAILGSVVVEGGDGSEYTTVALFSSPSILRPLPLGFPVRLLP